jgi:hypothetical protein
VVDALAEDRRALTRFRNCDPAGAQDINDYLTLLEAHLGHVEDLAHQAIGAPRQVRHTLLAKVHSNRLYGETQP